MVSPTLPSGALVALATPMTTAGELDLVALDRLVDHVVAGGIVGISPCGSTGEGARLTVRERLSVTGRVIARAGALPVIPGVPVSAVPDAEMELRKLGDLGARAALVAPPAYFPMSDAEIEGFYRGLADRSPVPIVLYNIPAFTRVPLPPSLVGRLATHGNIVGLKDSSRDLEYLQAAVQAVQLLQTGQSELANYFRVYTGTDTLLVASALAGADGSIAASANLVPELGVRMLELVSTDLPEALTLQRHLIDIVAVCRKGTPPSGWKAALSIAGLCSPVPVAPASPLSEDAIRRMREDLLSVEALRVARLGAH